MHPSCPTSRRAEPRQRRRGSSRIPEDRSTMERDRLRRSLEHLRIPLSDYRVLKLLPLVYVAWVDGKIERVKKDRIHAYAAREYDLSPAGDAVLDRWLSI